MNNLVKDINISLIRKKVNKKIPIEFFREVDSTNTFLKNNVENIHSNLILIANKQTQGKGRLGRSFVSNSDGGIYMSFLLKDNISIELAKKMTCITCVALCMAIEEVAKIKTNIKWVNDIYINNLKLAGILTEAKINQSRVDYVVVGLGVNVYKQDFGVDVNKIATTLEDQCNKQISRNILIITIINKLFKLLEDIDYDYIYNEYKKRLFVLNKEATFQIGDIFKKGKILDLNKDFNLIVEVDKKKEEIFSGEITKVKLL